MGMLDDRVVAVTGAGQGLGREFSLLMAEADEAVAVNDLGCAPDGSGADPALAEEVAAEITARGGRAVADSSDVSAIAGAQAVLRTALDAFGRVDVIVNNAGVLRDRMLVNMSESEWDDVIAGQLRSTFCGCRVFAGHWRDQNKAGQAKRAAIVNASSTSGLYGAVGQTNYGAAKAGIASLTVILAQELERYGVRVNAVVPVARTRMTEHVPGVAEMVAQPEDEASFDAYHPRNVAALIAWLSSSECTVTGEVLYAKGGEVRRLQGWRSGAVIETGGQWELAELAERMPSLLSAARSWPADDLMATSVINRGGSN